MSASVAELLRQRLSALDPVTVDIRDDSHLHAGHPGASGGGHFQVGIVSPRFAGLNTMARHRLVYEAVGDLMRGPVHALVIRARTPDEV